MKVDQKEPAGHVGFKLPDFGIKPKAQTKVLIRPNDACFRRLKANRLAFDTHCKPSYVAFHSKGSYVSSLLPIM